MDINVGPWDLVSLDCQHLKRRPSTATTS